MRKFLRFVSIIFLIAAVCVAGILFTPLGERPLTALFAVGEVAPFDFAAPALGDRPNQFLMCPPGLCGTAADAESPVFDVPAELLRARWQAVVAAEPRVTRLTKQADGAQLDYVQRSARFRFPDIVTVRFIAVSPSRSTLAVYSRAVYGRRDFGVNRARVETWLTLVRAGL